MRRLVVSVLVSLLFVIGLGVLSSPVPLAQRAPTPPPQAGPDQRGGFDISGPYEVDPNWPKKTWPKPGYIWGSQSGVYPETPNKVFLTSRGELELPKDKKLPNNFAGNWGALNLGGATGPVPDFRNCILIIDGTGNLVESWTQWDKLFEDGRGPHQIYVQPYDPERHVWVVDDMNHSIWKFTNDGKQLVMTLGEKGIFGDNADLAHFNRPTMIDWLPDGTFFVSDGYSNSRVVKFDKNGKALMWWGGPGTGNKPGEFTVPHGIAVGEDRRVYVSDRFNRRIQVFDENGLYLDQWPSGYCHSLSMSSDQHLWCYDGDHEQFIKYDLRGHIEETFGRYGTYPGATWGVHQISADSDGNLYAAEVFGGRTQKFRPKPGVDSSRLFWGRPVAPKTAARPISTVTMASPTIPRATTPGGAPGASAPAKMPSFAGTWKYDTAKSQNAVSGGMGSGAGEPPITMTLSQTATEIAIDMQYQSGRALRAVYTLDEKQNQMPDPAPGGKYPYKRKMHWDGAANRLVLYTVHGLDQTREIWTLEGSELKMQRDAQSPGGADGATRRVVYNK